MQALEAARTFEEGVVTDPREADVGSILGFGFAPYHRRHAELYRRYGRRQFRRSSATAFEEVWAALLAARPTSRYGEIARDSFYGRAAAQAKAA